MLRVITACLILLPGVALAHPGHVTQGDFTTGFLHPMLGPDHVLAMVAVGLWAAVIGSPATWLLPLTFPLAMLAGGALGAFGVALPAVEAGIAASAIVIGVAVMLALRPPMWLATLAVAVFAVFHGHAHGTEMPGAADPFRYALGFVLATVLLHLVGIGLGRMTRSAALTLPLHGLGGLIAVGGLGFLVG